MVDVRNILMQIKRLEDETIHDVVKELAPSLSNSSLQAIISSCARSLLDNKDKEIPCSVFTSVIYATIMCSTRVRIVGEVTPESLLKWLYYVVMAALQNQPRLSDSFVCYPSMLDEVKLCFHLCNMDEKEVFTYGHSIYQRVHNASQELSATNACNALTLQAYSIHFALVSGSLDLETGIIRAIKSMNRASLVGLVPPGLIVEFCQNLLGDLTLLPIEAVNEKSILVLLVDCIKWLAKAQQYDGWRGMTAPVVKWLEKWCGKDVISGFSCAIDLLEVALQQISGKCDGNQFAMVAEASNIIPVKFSRPNVLVMEGLLGMLSLFEINNAKKIMVNVISHDAAFTVMLLICKRITGTVDQLLAIKILKSLELLLYSFCLHFNEARSGIVSSLKKYFSLCKCTEMMIFKYFLAHKGDSAVCSKIVSCGVYIWNMGIYAERAEAYDLASDYFGTFVRLADANSFLPIETQTKSREIFSRQFNLWVLALRSSKQFQEAACAILRGLCAGYMSYEEAIVLWVKIKRSCDVSNSDVLKSMTFCDKYNNEKNNYFCVPELTVTNWQLLLKEMETYCEQSYDTFPSQLLCSRRMVVESKDSEQRIKSELMIVQVLWVNPNLGEEEESAMQHVENAFQILRKAKATKSKRKYEAHMMELEAEGNFWLMMCRLQQINEMSQAELAEAQKLNSVIMESSELGEEVPVSNSCEMRPALSNLTLSDQLETLAPLDISLTLWETLLKEKAKINYPRSLCQCLISVAFVYKLSGSLPQSLRTYRVLLSQARHNTLWTYFLRGACDLILMAPELIQEELIAEVLIICEKGLEHPENTVFHGEAALMKPVLAFYHFKNGKYKEGLVFLNESLNHKLMTKNFMEAKEFQCITHYVSSHYAWLPDVLLDDSHNTLLPSVVSATFSCRAAMGLIDYCTGLTNASDFFCYRHHLAWLYILMSEWLGFICWTTGQSRCARSYLHGVLSLSQQLTLPLRTAELFELLARVDLLCDLMADCRVKVDSLVGLLCAHRTGHQTILSTSIQAETKLEKKTGINCQPKVFITDADLEEEELLNISGNFQLHSVLGGTGHIIAAGGEKGIRRLLDHEYPVSPSLRYREEVSTTLWDACPSGASVECPTCQMPAVQRIKISTTLMLALIHAHEGSIGAALVSLELAEKMCQDMEKSSEYLASYFLSITSSSETEAEMESSKLFLASEMNQAYLQLYFTYVEVLAIGGKYKESLSKCQEGMQWTRLQDQKIMLRDSHFVVRLILQGYGLEKMILKYETGNSLEIAFEDLSISPNVDGSSGFKTPLRNLPPCTPKKGPRRRLEVLAAHDPPDCSVKVGRKLSTRAFDIYVSDDSDGEGFGKTFALSRLPGGEEADQGAVTPNVALQLPSSKVIRRAKGVLSCSEADDFPIEKFNLYESPSNDMVFKLPEATTALRRLRTYRSRKESEGEKDEDGKWENTVQTNRLRHNIFSLSDSEDDCQDMKIGASPIFTKKNSVRKSGRSTKPSENVFVTPNELPKSTTKKGRDENTASLRKTRVKREEGASKSTASRSMRLV